MQVSIFCTLSSRKPIHAPKMGGARGFDPLNGEWQQRDPKRHIPRRDHPRCRSVTCVVHPGFIKIRSGMLEPRRSKYALSHYFGHRLLQHGHASWQLTSRITVLIELHRESKKRHQTLGHNFTIIQFSKFFSLADSGSKFATNSCFNIPPCFKLKPLFCLCKLYPRCSAYICANIVKQISNTVEMFVTKKHIFVLYKHQVGEKWTDFNNFRYIKS